MTVSAQAPIVTAKDLSVLEGPKWSGALSYLDYATNKRSNIRSELQISRKAPGVDVWVFEYIYPDEPKANTKGELAIADGGRTFAGGSVIKKKRERNGVLRITTTKAGKDDDRKALFRYTYLISSDSFSIKKEIQLDGKTEWFERNEYSWNR